LNGKRACVAGVRHVIKNDSTTATTMKAQKSHKLNSELNPLELYTYM